MSDSTSTTGADRLLAVAGMTALGCPNMFELEIDNDACEPEYIISRHDTLQLDAPALNKLRCFRTPETWAGRGNGKGPMHGAFEWGLEWNKAVARSDAKLLHTLLSTLAAPVVSIHFHMLNIDADV